MLQLLGKKFFWIGLMAWVFSNSLQAAEKKVEKKAEKKAEKQEAKAEETVIADVNGVKVTLEQLEERLNNLPVNLQASFRSRKDLLLEDMVNQQLLLQEAQKRKLENDSKVQKSFDLLKQNILIQRVLELEVLEKAKVSSEKAKAYYTEHKEEFKTPETIHPHHILLPDENKAKEVESRLAKGEDFAALAKEVSVCPSAPRGGDLGTVRKGQMVPEFEEAAYQLKIGEISPIVKTQFGYHLIKVTEKEPSKERNFEEVAQDIEGQLLDTQRREMLQSYLKELKDKGQVKIYPEKLK